MNFTAPDFLPALPELALLTLTCVLLIVDLFIDDARKRLTYWFAQSSVFVVLLVQVAIAMSTQWGVMTSFSGMVVLDPLATTMKLAAEVSLMLVFLYSRERLAAIGLLKGEFFVLALFALLGVIVMISANHLLLSYMGLELMSLSLYALVAMQRDSRLSVEAAMKYFVLGALASGLLLFGMSMLYGATGTLHLPVIFNALAEGHIHAPVLLYLSVIFLVAGICFKLGAAPFHMWVPDVYSGAATPVALLVGSAPKLAAFVMMWRLLVAGLALVAPAWQLLFLAVAVLSIVIGNLSAIVQSNFKRLLAYSAIANMGFMLLGMIAGGGQFLQSGRFDGFEASLFYILAYVLTTLVSFGALMLIERGTEEVTSLEDLKGLNARSPWLAALLGLAMLSLAGIPSTIGFLAKFSVIEAAINQGYWQWAVFAVVASLVGAYYYLRVIKFMYFDSPTDTSSLHIPVGVRIFLSVNGLLLLVLGVFPQRLFELCVLAFGG